jgi:hypothetical protein
MTLEIWRHFEKIDMEIWRYEHMKYLFFVG